MKLSKVLLSSAVLVAAMATMFVGCKAEDEDEHGILDVSGSTVYVDYNNETSDIHRGFVTTKTNHRAAVAVFTVDTNASSENPGNLGFLFDVVKTDANKQTNPSIKVDTYNFGNVTVSWTKNTQGSKKAGLNTYVSYYKGVATKDENGSSLLDGGNNFKDASGAAITNTENALGAKETEYVRTWTHFDSISAGADGLIKVVVVVTPVAPKVDKGNGSYEVAFYDVSKIAENGKKSDPATWIASNSSVLINKVSIPASWTANADTEESKLPQSLIGFYSAVRPNSNLIGNINLPYIQNESDVIEWDEIQY